MSSESFVSNKHGNQILVISPHCQLVCLCQRCSMIISIGLATSYCCYFPFLPCILLFQFNCPTVKNTDKTSKFPPRVTGGKWGTGAGGPLDGVDRRSRCWSGSRGWIVVIMNKGRWIGRNGLKRSIAEGLKSWWEQNKSEPSDIIWVDRMPIRRRRCSKDNAREQFTQEEMFYIDSHWVVRGKGRSPPTSIHRVPHSSRGERRNHFIRWVSLSLVARAICVIAVRSSRNDLMVVIGRSKWAYNVGRMKCGPSD